MHFGVKGWRWRLRGRRCSSRLKEWRWRLRGCSLRLRGRDAEPGGILGVNTPPPTFWRTQKMEVREGEQ